MATMDEISRGKQSKCCAAPVHVSSGDGDFIGGAAVTCWFACGECNRACDLEEAPDDE